MSRRARDRVSYVNHLGDFVLVAPSPIYLMPCIRSSLEITGDARAIPNDDAEGREYRWLYKWAREFWHELRVGIAKDKESGRVDFHAQDSQALEQEFGSMFDLENPNEPGQSESEKAVYSCGLNDSLEQMDLFNNERMFRPPEVLDEDTRKPTFAQLKQLYKHAMGARRDCSIYINLRDLSATDASPKILIMINFDSLQMRFGKAGESRRCLGRAVSRVGFNSVQQVHKAGDENTLTICYTNVDWGFATADRNRKIYDKNAEYYQYLMSPELHTVI